MIIIQNLAGEWELRDGDDSLMCTVRCESIGEAVEVMVINHPEFADEIGELDPNWLAGGSRPKPARNGQKTPRQASRVRGGAARQPGSGQRFRELILGGATNDEALEVIKREFPEGRATLSDAAWNRYELRRHPDWYDERGFRIKAGRA